MRLPVPLLLVAVVALTACQPSRYRIYAYAGDGQVALTVSPEDLAGALSVHPRRFTVRDSETVVWDIEQDDRNCSAGGRANAYPMVYGHAPPCYRTLVPAQPLRPDSIYMASGEGSRDGSGYFIPGPPAQNFTYDEVEDRVRGWSPIAEPPANDLLANGF